MATATHPFRHLDTSRRRRRLLPNRHRLSHRRRRGIREAEAPASRASERERASRRPHVLAGPKRCLVCVVDGPDDSLRAPDAFAQLLESLARETDGAVHSLSLIEADAPVVLTREYPSDYGNRFPSELLDVATAQDLLFGEASTADVEFAGAEWSNDFGVDFEGPLTQSRARGSWLPAASDSPAVKTVVEDAPAVRSTTQWPAHRGGIARNFAKLVFLGCSLGRFSYTLAE